MFKKSFFLWFLFFSLFGIMPFFSSCSCGDDEDVASKDDDDSGDDDDVSDGKVFKVELTPDVLEIEAGETGQLTATAYDADNQVIAGATFVWNSDNPDVATVDTTGLVTGVADGTAVVTASSGGVVSNSCKVTVGKAIGAPVKLDVAPSSITLYINEKKQFTATAYDANNNIVEGVAIEWSLNGGAEMGTIDDKGLYTAPGAGRDDIQVIAAAPDYGLEASADVTVIAQNPVPQITSLDPQAVNAGAPDFQMVVSGSGFVSGTQLFFGGGELSITIDSDKQITATVTANLVAQPGEKVVQAFNPPPAGGQSNKVYFTVNPPQNEIPVIASISPQGIPAGSPDTTLTINGESFVTDASVKLIDTVTEKETELEVVGRVSDAQLLAIVPAELLTTAGVEYDVIVTNPPPGGGDSSPVRLTVTEPPETPESPTLTGLNPSAAFEGDPEFTLTLTGTNFQSASVVEFDGEELGSIDFTSETEISVDVPAELISTAGPNYTPRVANVRVINPAPSGSSNYLKFTINPSKKPTPAITKLEPATAVEGGSAFTLFVTGTDFQPDCQVFFDGVARITNFNPATPTMISAEIPAAAIATAGDISVYVKNPPTSANSNTLTFSVVEANPVPQLTSINPDDAQAGSGDIALTLQGANFVQGITAYFNGSALVTSFIDETSASATVVSALLTESGTFDVWVKNPPPGGGESNRLPFIVTAGQPVLSELFPTAVFTSTDFTIFAKGSNFAANSNMTLNNLNLADMEYLSSEKLISDVPGTLEDLKTPGEIEIRVLNPPPGGGLSSPLPITVRSPKPVVDSLNWAAMKQETAAKLIVGGSGFLPNATVKINGTELTGYPTTTTATKIEIDLPATAGVLSTLGVFNVVVENPAPTEGSSLPLKLTVIDDVAAPPIITKLSKNTAIVGSNQILITVTGEGFKNPMTGTFGGGYTISSITYKSATEVDIAIPASELDTVGDFEIVLNDGSDDTNIVWFTVLPDKKVPGAISIADQSTYVGNRSTDLEITVNADTGKFTDDAKVLLNGAPLVTVWKSDTQLTATVPPICTWPGTRKISVRQSGPNGGTTAPVNLTFTQP
ncbi:MAG: hypothetical protein Kow0090_12990 [Myxococcota bacterium]